MDMNRPIEDRIQRLPEDPVDLSDPGILSETSKELDELFKSRVGIFRASSKSVDPSRSHGWEPLVLKRRKTAILNQMPEAQKRFGAKYPALSIPAVLAQLNAPLVNKTFQALNKQYAVDLAAGIFILDYLNENDLFDEARPYFPSSREELDTVYLPNLSDSVHSDDELRSVLYVIQNRNRRSSADNDSGVLCGEADTRLRQDGDREPSQDKKNYQAVMALIDEKTVKDAEDAYLDCLWESFDQLTSVIDRLLCEQRDRQRALSELKAGRFRGFEETRSGEPAPEDREAARLKEALTKGSADMEALFFCLPEFPYWTEGDLPQDGGTDIFTALQPPVIRDPYQMCFALLALLRDDSDGAWLYNLSLNTAAFACLALPWSDSNVVDPDGDAEELSIDYAYLRSVVERKPDRIEDIAADPLYELCIPSPLLKQKRTRTSIARLAFLSSGLIPPRTGTPISFTRALLSETDFSPEVQDMLYYYFSLAYSVNRKSDDYQPFAEGAITAEATDEKADEANREEIKKLRSRIKQLKGMVHQAEHQNKLLTSQLNSTQQKLDASNAQLAELRTMIRESCETEESPTLIDFPYTAKRRTVIIGGRESWLKAIRPLLDNVRYISPAEQPNPAVILNAEAVWIQTNAIGHSSFYKVIDIIRRNDIPVYYFKFASAEKCAEQIALAETEEEDEA